MIKVKIVDQTGHTELEFKTAETAIQKALDTAKLNGQWIYHNATYVEPENLTPNMLGEDDELTLTNPLVGG